MDRGHVVLATCVHIRVILGHLKKIISFSSSWLCNLKAAGGNLINPLRMRKRVTVVCLSVCLHVCLSVC